jgi:hypothetical protein
MGQNQTAMKPRMKFTKETSDPNIETISHDEKVLNKSNELNIDEIRNLIRDYINNLRSVKEREEKNKIDTNIECINKEVLDCINNNKQLECTTTELLDCIIKEANQLPKFQEDVAVNQLLQNMQDTQPTLNIKDVLSANQLPMIQDILSANQLPINQKDVLLVNQKDVLPVNQKDVLPVNQKDVLPVNQKDVLPVNQKQLENETETIIHNNKSFKKIVAPLTNLQLTNLPITNLPKRRKVISVFH